MVQYTLPQAPELKINVSGKDSAKARDKAMEKLIGLIESGEIPPETADGFGPQQFIEVDEPGTLIVGSEDALNQAVQILSGLATLKLKAQDSRAAALEVREKIDILFTDDPISEEDIAEFKDGFKILKTYAQANLKYRAARAQAETAREVLDEALKSPDPDPEDIPEETTKTKSKKR
ncbi:hypothetical protein IQ266_07255 [filamentous cyanobacterium LEGE 11480]|uniref:Uncharacterized protein n=1 Tax=Romeriopsis navalis LEGE 11480 TaxID=2777977 RepID=A0A928VNB3_9CYAN|nr:hypothetical protein [Romeriopsis navalis]MBE9029557.1 hypothetical protein [Romeriopsis navalis LEGE 11480]